VIVPAEGWDTRLWNPTFRKARLLRNSVVPPRLGSFFPLFPTAYAVGCILTPLRGCKPQTLVPPRQRNLSSHAHSPGAEILRLLSHWLPHKVSFVTDSKRERWGTRRLSEGRTRRPKLDAGVESQVSNARLGHPADRPDHFSMNPGTLCTSIEESLPDRWPSQSTRFDAIESSSSARLVSSNRVPLASRPTTVLD
jgi:hypothetical protein